MSTPFLSRQDIESWVPEAAASKGTVGFVAKLSTSIGRAIASLGTILVGRQDEAYRICQNELERFLLWCQGLGVTDGRLDDVLSRSERLHRQVLSLLLPLGNSLLQAMSQLSVPLSQLQLDVCDHLKSLLDAAETMLKGSDSDEHERPDTPSGSDESDYGLVGNIEEISAYVDCLLDLAPALDNPALDIQIDVPAEPLSGANESSTTSCEEALIYCRKIRDRFDLLPKYLVERLAEANVVRAAKIREMQRKTIERETADNDNITESLFSGQQPQITETTNSSVPPPSVFSSVMASSSKWSARSASASKVGLADFDDNTSEATFASFSTTASSSVMGRPRIPAMPDVQEGGFDCTVCLERLTDITTRKEWKSHVFDDLKPCLCTVRDCQNSSVLYSHSRIWAQHESSHSAGASVFSECAFCSAAYQQLGPAYFKHVSGHLREISLSVLPQMTDDIESTDDDESRIDDADLDDEAKPHEPGPPFDSMTLSVDEVNRLDRITDQLLNARKLKPRITDQLLNAGMPTVQLLISDIQYLCRKARDIFLSQPVLLELEAPLIFVGDIRGQFDSLLRVFDVGGLPPKSNYLFLGNYVDYGMQSLEVMCLLLAFKIQYPENFFLLRGNHETASVSRELGFYSECKKRYGIQLWKVFIDIFNHMPLAANVDEKIFCVHGGLSPDLDSLERIRRIRRPTDVPDCGLLCDLMWSKPDPLIEGWSENDDGLSFIFGPNVVSRFLQKHDMDLILRGHEVVPKGYDFFAKRQLVALWTAPDWKDSGNDGAIMTVDETLLCEFKLLKPVVNNP